MNLPIPGFNPRTPNINLALETGHFGIASRLANQNRRIHLGVESGTLNRPEQKALWAQRKTFGETLTNDLRGDVPFQGQFKSQLNASSSDIYQYRRNA